MEYMIQENTLTEIANALRNKLVYKDIASALISDRNKIVSMEIPDSVKSISRHAFSDCTSLESITIPNSVTIIGSYAFRGCTSLESLTIPDSVTMMDFGICIGCDNLTDMYLHPTTPPTLGATNAISTATTTIHVPVGCGDAYKTATNWSAYADIIVEDIVIE